MGINPWQVPYLANLWCHCWTNHLRIVNLLSAFLTQASIWWIHIHKFLHMKNLWSQESGCTCIQQSVDWGNSNGNNSSFRHSMLAKIWTVHMSKKSFHLIFKSHENVLWNIYFKKWKQAALRKRSKQYKSEKHLQEHLPYLNWLDARNKWFFSDTCTLG